MRTKLRAWRAWAVVPALLLGLAGAVHAQDKVVAASAPDAKLMDQKIHDLLKTVINTGADLYNRDNDRAACYHLYQGSLLTLKPLLGHHPELQKSIDEALESTDRQGSMGSRAHKLREALGSIRDALKPTTAVASDKPATSPGTQSTKPSTAADTAKPAPPVSTTVLWERLGGEARVRKIVDDFVAQAASDAKVNFDRGGKYKLVAPTLDQLKNQLVAFVSQATGGPIKYTGKSMKDVHKGMGITDAEFDAAAGDLRKALELNGIKADDIKEALAAVEQTRKDIVEPKEAPKPAVSLWDRLGGDGNVRLVVDDFVDLAAADQKVNFDRGGKYKLDARAVKRQLVAYISQNTGGPLKYEGKSMKDVHKGMGITDAEFNALAADLKKALLKNAVRTEDVDALLKVVEETRKDIVEPK